MLIAGVDFESQDADAKTCNVTEVGAELVEIVFHDDGKPTEFFSKGKVETLVYDPDYPPQTPEIVELTGITDTALKLEGIFPHEAFRKLNALMEKADYVFAHNKLFDQTVYESVCARLGLEPVRKTWICTLTEVPYAKKYTCRKLAHLALDHGLRMDGRNLHRALDDVRLMLELITTKYDVRDVLRYASMPWVFLKADILGPWKGPGGDGGAGKLAAQKIGFGWEGVRHTSENFPKTWVMRVKEDQLQATIELGLTSTPPFRISRIK